MFVLLTYLFLDEDFDLDFSTDHRLVVQLLLSNYPDSQWDSINDKSKILCSYVFKSYGLDTPDEDEMAEVDKSEQLVLACDKSWPTAAEASAALSTNILYHRIYHFISSLGYSTDKKANKFRFDLAYYSACNLLMSFNVAQEQMETSTSSSEGENDKTLLNVRKHLTDNYLDVRAAKISLSQPFSAFLSNLERFQYKHLASMAQEKLSQIYMSSTYAMYNLIRLLEIVIADIAMSQSDDELKMVSERWI